jgi:hypothetical protein
MGQLVPKSPRAVRNAIQRNRVVTAIDCGNLTIDEIELITKSHTNKLTEAEIDVILEDAWKLVRSDYGIQ